MLNKATAEVIVDERRRMANEALNLYRKLGRADAWRSYTRRQTWYESAKYLWFCMKEAQWQ